MNDLHSQQGQTFDFDVLVIGCGLAGLHYCAQLLEHSPKRKIAILSKINAEECNSWYAQGGIAAVSHAKDSIDSFESHIEDTIRAGDGLCYRPTVEAIIHQGPTAITQLEAYTIPFEKTAGIYDLGQEGGHSHRRIYHCGDQTGATFISILLAFLKSHPQVAFFEDHMAVNLITHYHPHCVTTQGEVLGAYVLESRTHKIHTFLARAVVLATGGAGKTYRYTSNPMLATGDGVAMAYRAGARVGNMEFYQFHPTLLYHHSIHNFLISEAVRGEGGLLLHPDSKERFMHRYAPEQQELATRDVVARAIFSEIEQSEHNFVYLDVHHQSRAFLKQRFPQIFQTLLSIGIDMSQDLIPVVPAAHYQCGGILTDINGRTDLKRLYAIGEVAFSGLHGANRLASNSLLEAVVMASSAARSSIQDITVPIDSTYQIFNWQSGNEYNPRRASQINAQWLGLRGEMTSYAGIVRTEAGLEDLLRLISHRRAVVEEYYWKHHITRDFIELRNIILNAELIVNAALSRRESRGGHYREDFPHKIDHARESISQMKMPLHAFFS